MSIGMTTQNQSMETMLNYATQIRIVLEFMYNLKASMQTLPGMLKQNLVHHTMKLKCHFTWAKIKKTNRTSEGWIGWENSERMCKPKT